MNAPEPSHRILLPDPALILLMGISGSGKSHFAARHFSPYAVVSSDRLRGVVSNEESNQAASADAFALLHQIVVYRLKRRLLTVVDATHLQSRSRYDLRKQAEQAQIPRVLLLFDLPMALCRRRNRQRLERIVPDAVLNRQRQQLQQSLTELESEAFVLWHTFTSAEAVEQVILERVDAQPSQSSVAERD